MINIKYYIILIMTLFLSIGIGIFVGFNMNNGNMIDESQAALADQIQLEFSRLRKENTSLLDELSQLTKERNTYETINKIMYQELTKEKLVGTSIAIVQIGDAYDYQDMKSSLETAGAEIASWLIIYSDTKGSYSDMVQQIVLALQQGIEDDHYKQLLDNGYIKSLIPIKSVPDFIILAVGGPSNQRLELELTWAVKATDIPLAAVEQELVSNSHMQLYKKEGISTIDNIDSSIGKLSLIAVIRGVDGHYGVKSAAEAIMANSLETSAQEAESNDER
ncbi:copper transporter [Mahella australiensis]|uniref:Copper transporter n=1 Tax=Mahella australiensis (strain DSM 15567 / CIP 107919 / 50-1 BON) TaxID=697281 RepID=F3ZXY1_MAHA5|nr:copper transporter [Mahella australiensis]AEE96651.1 hypothetical protein Mahau_1459 [Mahella australiensis 50-1 BON]